MKLINSTGSSINLRNLRVTIVGLGLMGGSLAMAIKGRVLSLTAVDTNRDVLNQAERIRLVDNTSMELANTLSSTDLLILAIPVKQIASILEWLPSIGDKTITIIDLGSTKKEICRLMSMLPENYGAIGGHPMCGREKSGLTAAQESLYRNQPFVLCRTSRTHAFTEKIALQLVHLVGGYPLFMSPSAHDETVAATSHLPYVTSIALMDVVNNMALTNQNTWTISATGLRDTTRLAGSDPQMMLEILMSNKKSISKQLASYVSIIKELSDYLESEDEQRLLKRLSDIQEHYRAYRQAKETRP